jgi:hypothetical protein
MATKQERESDFNLQLYCMAMDKEKLEARLRQFPDSEEKLLSFYTANIERQENILNLMKSRLTDKVFMATKLKENIEVSLKISKEIAKLDKAMQPLLDLVKAEKKEKIKTLQAEIDSLSKS